MKHSYSYYTKRTLHKSSLSPSVYAIVGNEMNDSKAFQHFLVSLYADLRDIHGNTKEGIHGASLGGTWQAVINGFGGMRIKQDILSFKPKLPLGWHKIAFSLSWKGNTISVWAFHDKIELYYKTKKRGDKIRLWVYNVLKTLPANRRVTFRRP